MKRILLSFEGLLVLTGKVSGFAGSGFGLGEGLWDHFLLYLF